MQRILTVALVVTLLAAGLAGAGPRRAAPRITGGVSPGVPLNRQIHHPVYPIAPYYYLPYQVPVLVVSPYGPSYYVPPAVVVTWPYFCVFHNDGFISRIGLLDHLAGTHKIPLDAAANLCPDGVSSCVFPAY